MKTVRNFKTVVASCMLLLFLAGTMTSCQSTRKCNGEKGIRTPMGLM